MRTLWGLGLLCALGAGCASDPADGCAMTVAAYCANGTCPSTWVEATQPSTWGCDATHRENITLFTCGDVRIARESGIDSGQDYYYDTSGHLYHVQTWADAGLLTSCAAGRGATTTCNDPNPVTVCTTHAR